MQQPLEQSNDIRTVWLLTMGSRFRATRTAILAVRIPALCRAIQAEQSLRMVSALMYGASLIFRHQTNYFLSDLAVLTGQLRHLSTTAVELAGTTRPIRVLRDDPEFVLDEYGGVGWEEWWQSQENSGESTAVFERHRQSPYQHGAVMDVDLEGEMARQTWVDEGDYDWPGPVDMGTPRTPTPRTPGPGPGLELEFELDMSPWPLLGELAVELVVQLAAADATQPTAAVAALLAVKRRRIVVDAVLELSDAQFARFSSSYNDTMALAMLRRRTRLAPANVAQSSEPDELSLGPSTPEARRRAVVDWSETLWNESLFDFSAIGESSGTALAVLAVIPPRGRDESTRFLQYLHSFDQPRLEFTTICPRECPRELAAKSFMSLMQLATSGRVRIKPSSGRAEDVVVVVVVVVGV